MPLTNRRIVANLAPCLALSLITTFYFAGNRHALAEPGSGATTVQVSVPVKEKNSSNDEFEARMKAEAMAAEQRQNEAVQHCDASRSYLSNGNTEMAELEMQAAIMDDPKIKAYHRDFCLIALLRGHPMRAVAEAMMVVGLGDPIPLNEKQMTKLKEQGCKLHYRRGLELAAAKKWKDAITEFQWALEYRPGTAAVMRSMAFANANLGNIELAERQYGSSFAADPADAYGHADLAFILADTGKGGEAIKQLQEAVKLQPKVAALHIDLGWMAESKGNLDEAEGEFSEAVKLSPTHASLWTHLGKIRARQGKESEAADAYKTALGLDPSAEDAKHGLDGLARGGGKSSATISPDAAAGAPAKDEKSAHDGSPAHEGGSAHEGSPAHEGSSAHAGNSAHEGSPAREGSPAHENGPAHDGDHAHQSGAHHDLNGPSSHSGSNIQDGKSSGGGATSTPPKLIRQDA